ncbi:MAG: hypothetical protein C4288_16685 [Leptolyngbya sp. ERB_1_1]
MGYETSNALLSTNSFQGKVMTASQRPKGVTILAWLAIIGGVVSLLSVFGGNIFGLIIGVLNLIFGFGALALKPWAWIYGILVQIPGILSSLVLLGSSQTLPIGVVAIVIYGLILYYLFTPSVKRVFGKA